jgi:hypothetical protein
MIGKSSDCRLPVAQPATRDIEGRRSSDDLGPLWLMEFPAPIQSF